MPPEAEDTTEGVEDDFSGSDDEFDTQEELGTEDDFTEDDEDVEASAEDEGQGDEFVKVVVDGQEIEIPLSEALSGYQRQADYTRKTQEVAQEREQLAHMSRLMTALERDPSGTLAALAGQLGVELAPPAPQGAGQSVDSPAEGIDWDDLDPDVAPVLQGLMAEIGSLKDQLGQTEQWRVTQQEAEQMAALDREVEAVRVRHNAPDLDADELYGFAADQGIPNLDAAYVYLQQVKAATKAPSGGEQRERKRTAPRVEGGRRRTGSKKVLRGKPSLAQSLEAALESTGFSLD